MTQAELEPTEQVSMPATGHPQVDAVIDSVADLAGRPLEEHVAVFEQAHQALRGALNDASAAPRGPQPS